MILKLNDLGEEELLEIAKDICEVGSGVEMGIGDDAAVLKMGDDCLLISTDMILKGFHFTDGASARQIGRKAVVTNLSDIAAMGGESLGLVYSIGSLGEEDVDFFIDILEVMNDAAREHDTFVVGGDLNEANSLIISGTAFGRIGDGDLLTRSGAEPGDFIGLTGRLGTVPAAVRADLDSEISLEDWEGLKNALDNPVARLKEGRILSNVGGVNSAIDVTDGLVGDLWQISRSSGVGLTIHYDNLPVDPLAEEFSAENSFELDEFVLYGGEEFELLFTVESESWGKVEDRFQEIGTEVTKIGKVGKGGSVKLSKGEGEQELADRGFEHFG